MEHIMISEQENASVMAGPVADPPDNESLQSDLEQLAARIAEHLPRNAIDKLIDQLAKKMLEGQKDFDQNDLKDAIEVASYIATLSKNEQVKVVAADLRALGKDYAQYKESDNLFTGGLLLLELNVELKKLKKDIRSFAPKSLLLITLGLMRRCFDKVVLWGSAKLLGIMLAVFLCFPKRQRMSHNNGIAARGRFKVVPDPKFPPHEFFSPGKEFPLRIRHASATFLDDAMNCIRSLSLKLADTDFKSPFDLQMNTGATSLFWSATSFWKFAALRKEKYGIEYQEYNQKYPDGLEGSKIATRRHTAFERLHYFCKTPFLYNSSNGEKYFAKYRVIPFDRSDDPGIVTDRSDWDQCNQRVENHETRGRNYLKYAYADLVEQQGPVRYWLQIQTRLASDAETDPEVCNNMVVWDEPWYDLGVMEITETLDWRQSTLTSFSVNNMPKGLGVVPASSVYDYNSLNYLRSHAEMAYTARRWSYVFFGMVPPIPDNDNRNESDWGK